MGNVEEIVRPFEALARRCEEAAGADRDLDGAIDRMLNKRPVNGDYDAAERAIWKVDSGWSGLLVRSSDGFARGSFCADRFTASLDAAISLVPEGESICWQIGDGPWAGPYARICDALTGHEVGANAATSALALCAASLRIRDHLLSSKVGE